MSDSADDERTWSRWRSVFDSAVWIVLGLAAGYFAADAIILGKTTGWLSIFAVVSVLISAMTVVYGLVGVALALRRKRNADVNS
jgi:uncharacterized membrane protein HdeD (DUF308 family)